MINDHYISCQANVANLSSDTVTYPSGKISSETSVGTEIHKTDALSEKSKDNSTDLLKTFRFTLMQPPDSESQSKFLSVHLYLVINSFLLK